MDDSINFDKDDLQKYLMVAAAVGGGIWAARRAYQKARGTTGSSGGAQSLDDYVRMDNSNLEVAVKTFEHATTGQKVDLVGVIHIAEEDYFQDLKTHLDGLDTVLFEGVGDKNKAPDPDSPMVLIGRMYNAMAEVLDMTVQGNAIDYKSLPQSWEHCDMSEDQLRQSGGGLLFQKNKNSPAAQVVMGLLETYVGTLEQQAQTGLKISGRQKQMLARQFSGGDPLQKFLQGKMIEKFLGKAAIDGRNQVVKDRLAELAADSNVQHAGVFYGAAHMPDIEEYLLDNGYELTDTDWKRAWEA